MQFKISKNNSSLIIPGILVLLMVVGAGTIFFYAHSCSVDRKIYSSVIAICFIVAGTSMVVGGLLGFLFGIPKTIRIAERSSTVINYEPNTNLEQISDWLTKILVGIGLTQISELSAGFKQLIYAMSSALPGQNTSNIYLGALVMYYFVTGFLIGYVVTRLILVGALRYADISSQAQKQIDDLKKNQDDINLSGAIEKSDN